MGGCSAVGGGGGSQGGGACTRPTTTTCILPGGGPYPQLEGPRQSVGKKDKKRRERMHYRRAPLKEFGTALRLDLCSECRIFTSQQTIFV